MRDGKGYLLPPDPQPEGYQCLLLYIPDDPTGHYLAAMAGAFVDMGMWLNWEKDGTTRASLAAATWKKAIDKTFDEGWTNCMNIQDQLDDIFNQLKELNDMNVNVNCGCGCGGCGCKNGNGLVDENGLPINGPLPLPPSSTQPDEFLGQWRCDAAHQFIDDWIDFYNNIFNLGAFGNASLTAIISIAAAATILTGGVAAILLLVTVLTVAPVLTLADWVRDWLAENRDGLVCAMSDSLTPAAAFQNVLAYLLAHKADQNGSFAGEWIENVLKPVLQDTNWNLLYEEDSFPIDLSNQGSECLCEGTVIQPVQIGQGYWVVPVTSADTSQSTADVTNMGGNTWFIDGFDADIGRITPDLTEWGFVWTGVNNDGDGAGFRVQASVVNGFYVSNLFSSAFSMTGEFAIVQGVDYRGGIAAIAAWVALGDEEESILDAPSAEDRTDFILRSSDSGQQSTMTVRLWVVVPDSAQI